MKELSQVKSEAHLGIIQNIQDSNNMFFGDLLKDEFGNSYHHKQF